MTDPFEEAVRKAAQNLGSSAASQPTYHDAWQRGRRRRSAKRAGMAAAAAVVLVAALGVNLARSPESTTDVVDEVAIRAAQPTAIQEPDAVPTTPPVLPGTPESAAAAVAVAPEAAETEVMTPAPSVTSNEAPGAASDDDDAAASSAIAEAPQSQTTEVPSPSTDEAGIETPGSADGTTTVVPPPDDPNQPDPSAEPNPATSTAPDTVTETPDDPDPVDSEVDTSGTDTPDSDTTTTELADTELTAVDPDGVAATAPQTAPSPSFGLAAPLADAAIVGAGDRAQDLPCDTTGDGAVDGTCRLLPDYDCTSKTDAQPGYVAVDTDADDIVDTCRAVNLTMCDTTVDGLGDTPCVISLGAPEAEPTD